MIDQVRLNVGDAKRSKAFCEEALAPLGYRVIMEPVSGVVVGTPATTARSRSIPTATTSRRSTTRLRKPSRT